MSGDDNLTAGGGSVPVPDPTKLTTDAVNAATAQWRRDLQGLREILELTIRRVEDVAGERFKAIEARATQTAEESDRSLAAALSAAKEAVKEQNTASSLAIGKSEEGTKERLDGLGQQLAFAIKSLEEKIRSVESRLDRGEGTQVGAKETTADKRAGSSANMAVLGAVFVGVSLLIGVVSLIISLRIT